MEEMKTVLDVQARTYPVKDGGNLLAFASVNLNGCFVVTGIRLVTGEKGPFVSMPSRKDRNGEYHDVCFPITSDMRAAIQTAVLEEYQRATEGKPSLRGALQSAAKELAERPSQAEQENGEPEA